MSAETPQLPHLGPHAEAARAARLAREAAALRENLRRRKTQARAKDRPGEAPAAPPQSIPAETEAAQGDEAAAGSPQQTLES